MILWLRCRTSGAEEAADLDWHTRIPPAYSRLGALAGRAFLHKALIMLAIKGLDAGFTADEQAAMPLFSHRIR
jgi:hypothetical protein